MSKKWVLDNARIYSRALTASEVQALYAQTKDKYLAEDKWEGVISED